MKLIRRPHYILDKSLHPEPAIPSSNVTFVTSKKTKKTENPHFKPPGSSSRSNEEGIIRITWQELSSANMSMQSNQ